MEYKSYALTQQFEGLRLEAYQDTGGVWTIGFGHTKGVKKGDKCTEAQALAWLKEDMAEAVKAVNDLVKVSITQQQFDALCDFVFNLGVNAFRNSTLLRLLNTGDYKSAYNQFARWKYDNGRVIEGLVRRRKAEADLFIHA
jgi:lysozyme